MPDIVATLLIGAAWSVPLVVLHELGHGLAALALTRGRVSMELRHGGLSGGRIAYEAVGLRHPRAVALIAAAGPAVSLLSAAVLCVAWLGEDPGFAQRVIRTGALVAIVQFLVTALPIRYGAGLGPPSDSDGRVIWRVLTGAPPGGIDRELERSLKPERAARPVFVALLAPVAVLAFMVDPVTGVLLLAVMAVALLLQRSSAGHQR